jgi:hypothetical protein
VCTHAHSSLPSSLPPFLSQFNTSHAHAQHLVKYLANVAPESDFEFAFKIDDDFANIYEVREGGREGGRV